MSDSEVGILNLTSADKINRFIYQNDDTNKFDIRILDNGTRFIVREGDDFFERTLSVPYDISTASSESTVYTNIFGSQHRGFEFSDDGLTLFVSGYTNNVDIHTLTTPFDLSTASYSNTIDFSGDFSLLFNISIRNNGTKLYLSNLNQSIKEFTLTTPFNLTTAVYENQILFSDYGIPNGGSFTLSENGNFLIQNTFGNGLNQFQLTTPYDLSSAIYDGNISENTLIGYTAELLDIDFGETDNKFYFSTRRGGEMALHEFDVNTIIKKPIKLGQTNIKEIYYGNNLISKIYNGETEL